MSYKERRQLNREFKQITTAGATTATERVWGEYVSVDGLPNFSKAKYKDVENMRQRV